MPTDTSMPDLTESTALTAPTTQPTSPTTTCTIKKKKRKRKPKPSLIITQLTIRAPPWCYIHLQHLSPDPRRSTLDALTAHFHITCALSRFLGLHGEAMPFDILRLENNDVWIRIPAEDRDALIGAVGGWTSSNGEGWRVKGTSSWDARAMGGRDGARDLFDESMRQQTPRF